MMREVISAITHTQRRARNVLRTPRSNLPPLRDVDGTRRPVRDARSGHAVDAMQQRTL